MKRYKIGEKYLELGFKDYSNYPMNYQEECSKGWL